MLNSVGIVAFVFGFCGFYCLAFCVTCVFGSLYCLVVWAFVLLCFGCWMISCYLLFCLCCGCGFGCSGCVLIVVLGVGVGFGLGFLWAEWVVCL